MHVTFERSKTKYQTRLRILKATSKTQLRVATKLMIRMRTQGQLSY